MNIPLFSMESHFLTYKIMYDMLKSCLTVFQRHACGVRSLVIINGVILGHLTAVLWFIVPYSAINRVLPRTHQNSVFIKSVIRFLLVTLERYCIVYVLLFKSKSTNYFACARSFGRRPRSFKSFVSTSCKFVSHCRADNFALSIDSSSIYDSLNQNSLHRLHFEMDIEDAIFAPSDRKYAKKTLFSRARYCTANSR